MADKEPSSTVSELARQVVRSATPEQREALLSWATELEDIRNSPDSQMLKAQQAVKATVQRKVIAPVLRGIRNDAKRVAGRTKELLWDNRSWAARLGMIGLTIGTLGFSGKAAAHPTAC